MFLKKATPEDLRQELLHGIINLDSKKVSMLSMDGPNVNWLVLQLVNEHRKLNELAKLIPTGLSYYFSFRNKLDIVFINSWAGLVTCILQVNCGSHIWFSVFLALQFPPIMAVLMFYFDFLQVFAPFMWFMVRSKLDLSLYHGMSKTYWRQCSIYFMVHLHEEVCTSKKVDQMSFQSRKCVNVTPVFSGPEEIFYHCGQGQNRHFMQPLSICFAEKWVRRELNLWSLRLWLYMLC